MIVPKTIEWKSKLEKYTKLQTGNRSRLRALIIFLWGFLLKGYSSFLREEFVKMMPSSTKRDEICIDVGCGSGDSLIPVLKVKSYKGVGIDPIIEPHLRNLNTRIHKEELPIFIIRGVGEYLPLKDSIFSSAIIASTLDHVIDPNQVIREIHRVLIRNGNLLISQAIVERKGIFDDTHLWKFTTCDLRNLLRKNLFTVDQIRLFFEVPLLRHFYHLRKINLYLNKLLSPSTIFIRVKKIRNF